jgi:hypothetical protein
MSEVKEIFKIRVWSAAKILGLSSTIFGLIIGIIVGFIMFFVGTFLGTDNSFSSYLGATLGIAGFILMPLFIGFLGFVFGAFSAFLYNVFAAWFGGIKIELKNLEEK